MGFLARKAADSGVGILLFFCGLVWQFGGVKGRRTFGGIDRGMG